MKPFKTLLFTLGVFLLLAGSMWITPSEGIKAGGFTFHLPTLSEMMSAEEVVYADVSEIINSQFDIDTLTILLADTAMVEEEIERANYDSLIQKVHRIEMTDTGRIHLQHFFEKLHSDSLVRVMHYGDSQIEGDRITSLIRNKLQVRFGGSGPGLRPALQPYDFVFSAVQYNSGNWKRYPIYGDVDSMVMHSNYGVMGAFSRFAPLVIDSVPFVETELYEAEMSIMKSNVSFNRVKEYDHMRLFYGNTHSPVSLQLLVKGDTILSDTLKANLDYDVITCPLPDSTDHVTLRFSGYDSPDIYGIELASDTGVIVDNIALRGSSGTIFTKNDFAHSMQMYADLNPGLFILQFGGNVMPYIENQEAVERYGRWFKSQVLRLQRTCPGAAIIVIGPSDMATKVKDKYVTYPLLPSVVEALKKAALTTGCGYWDMYQAMGGHNSIPGWVNAEPELARPDYVHFSPRGARLIAGMFYNALLVEYNKYEKESMSR